MPKAAGGLKAFLLIGQSNMAGRGVASTVEAISDPDILMFRDGAWRQAVEPLHATRPEIDAVGLGMSFAAELRRSGVAERVGLIPCAVGGTPLSRWERGGDLYASAVEAAHAAIPPAKLAGVLWHQGESDAMSRDDASSYQDRLCGMIRALREEFGKPDLPFVAGELGRFLDATRYPYRQTINAALARLPEVAPPATCVSSGSLTALADSLHFNAISLREFGLRYARAFISLAAPNRRHP